VTRIGLISDTHGLLRAEALRALAGVEHIIHAGDIGSAEVLTQLGKIAPVTAVRGNNDKDAWAKKIAETEVVQLGGQSIYVLHDLSELDLDPAAAGFFVVVTGTRTSLSFRSAMACSS
jgi:putative phosphoesterase